MKTKLIIFDFDGTLGDTQENIVTTMQMTIDELGLPKRANKECISTIGLPLARCFETLFPDLQKEVIACCTDIYRRIFKDNLQTIKPKTFPHVVETLSKLREQGFILTIASSRSHASLVELTKTIGISDIISHLIGADDVEKGKPNPESVLKTLVKMKCSSDETLVVGDMAVDILMGNNAGTKTCGVTWGNGNNEELKQAGAHYIINRMDDLYEIANDSK
ncbi:MAG: HAD-IA family hydrolase [Bacteroidaceae bacterium]|nr:HAD-IA family hydrolase [Bacteroidaceae bacterium]